MQYKSIEKSRKTKKKGIEYNSFFLNPDFALGLAKFKNLNWSFYIQKKILRFNEFKFTKDIDSKKLEILIENNENFAKENNCTEIIYEFSPQLCSEKSMENSKPLKGILINRGYEFSELLNGFFNQGIKKIE